MDFLGAAIGSACVFDALDGPQMTLSIDRREAFTKVFCMKVSIVTLEGECEEACSLRDGCGQCLSIIDALVQLDNNLHG